MTRDGFIFVIVEGQDEDIFVKASKTRNALDGDTVRVAVTREEGRNKRREGEGKVQITINGCVREYDAVTDGPAIPTGACIKVVEVVNNSTVLVEEAGAMII